MKIIFNGDSTNKGKTLQLIPNILLY